MMNYPLISEYVEAIKMAEENFDELSYLRPVLDAEGQPVMSSGNFAVVFKMKDERDGKLYAVRCFHRDQEGRSESYRLIEEELKDVESPYLVSFRYMDKELFVDSSQTDETEFPILLMDWVEGITLDKYLRENLDDQYALEMLAYRFSQLAQWLIPQPFAHGDLKPDNILVHEDGTLVLVDYDGMYVPAMKGQKARELGSPDFRHPLRTEDDFDEHIDDFPFITILLSLKAIALKPSLLNEYGAADRLLFSEKDYRTLSESIALDALKSLIQDIEVTTLLSLFTLSISQCNLSSVSSHLLNLSKPNRMQTEEENLSTVVTDEDLVNAWTDEYGVLYSFDGKKLLRMEKPKIEVPYSKRWDFAYYKKKWLETYGTLKQYSVKNGTKVICNKAFSSCCGLLAVTIPDSVTHIGNGIFSYCDDLATIDVDENNTYYDSRNHCNAVIEKSTNQLIAGCKNSIIPNGIVSIAHNAFRGCSGIVSIGIPNSVKSIEEDAFRNCENLSFVDMPDSVTYIGEYAFQGCKNLTSLTIPDSVTSIGVYAFWGCSRLTSLIMGNSIPIISHGAFQDCKNLTSLVIPDSVTSIGEYAFEGCNSLTSLTISDNVTSIGKRAFMGCGGLTSLVIPDSVTSIGEHAFEGCRSLTSLTISDSVIYIGSHAFAHCEDLNSVIIPSGVTFIGKGVFDCCCSLVSIDVDKGNSYYDSRNHCKAIIETCTNTLIAGCNNSVIPDDVISIAEMAFRGCLSLRSVVIPNKVISIGWCAFQFCHGLTSVIIPDCMMSIGDEAFANCSKLAEVYIPNNRITVGESVFRGCTNLKKIKIPEGSLKKFELLLRAYKDKLDDTSPNYSTKVAEEDMTNAWVDADGVKYSIDRKRLLKAPNSLKGSDYIIKEGVCVICDGAFQSIGLHSLTLPDSLLTIGRAAFANNDEMEYCNIPFSVKTICDNNPWGGCFNIKKMDCLSPLYRLENGILYSSDFQVLYGLIYWHSDIIIDSRTKIISGNAFWANREKWNTFIKKLIIPDAVKSIGDAAFCCCSGLTSIQIPEGVTSIGKSAFEGCSSLCSVNIPNSTISIGSAAFKKCRSIVSINIPEGLTEIGELMFARCTNMNTVNIVGNIKSIGRAAFVDCVSLTLFKIPDSVTSIGEGAFSGCNSLRSMIIPDNVISIGQVAFGECGRLESITISNSATFSNKNSFYRCHGLKTIRIPKGSLQKFEDMLPYDLDKLEETAVDVLKK